MSRVSFLGGLLGCLLITLPAAAQAPTPKTADTDHALSPAAVSAYEMGNFWFQRNGMDEAAKRFAEFLKLAPDADQAAEALYKLGVAHTNLDNLEEAQAAFAKLARDYFSSPWAQLVLRSHFDEPALSDFINEAYTQARDSKKSAVAEQVQAALTIYVKRFGKEANLAECHYKLAVCALLQDDTEAYHKGLKVLVEKAGDSSWAALAAIRLGGKAAFCKHMDELVNLGGVDDENTHLFLELATTYLPQLKGEDKIKCRFFQARCLAETNQPGHLPILMELVKQHPHSPWAAEAAFWLAQHTYEEGEFGAAQKAYRNLAVKFPNSPRVPQASAWADWIDARKVCKQELEKAINDQLDRLDETALSLAASIEVKSSTLPAPVQAKFAYQKDRLLIELKHQKKQFLFVNNKDAAWYLTPDQKTLSKVKDFTLPVPKFKLAVDPKTGKGSFAAGLAGEDDNPASLISVPPEAVTVLVERVLKSCHARLVGSTDVTRSGDKKRQVFRLEDTDWQPGSLCTVEFILEDGVLREIHLNVHDGLKNSLDVRVKDIRIGETLPEAAFALPTLRNVKIREVEQINLLEVYGEAMEFLSTFTDNLPELGKWRPQ